MGILICIVGLIAVNVFSYAVGWYVTDWEWWVTVAPLCLFIGIAGASVSLR